MAPKEPRYYCQRCRGQKRLEAFNWERWEKTDYRICEACVMALQELGEDMVLATARESESMVRLSLMETHGGEIEVETAYGLIDLLTDERIYEVKHVKNWKDALKVLLFKFEFPDRKPTVYLFGSHTKAARQTITEAFQRLDIDVEWHQSPF